MNLFRALAIATTFASLAAAASPQDVGSRVAAVADLLGCSRADHEHLANGEVVACRSTGRRVRESTAVIVLAPPAATMRAMERADLYHADRRVLVSEELPAGEVDASAFAGLPIEAAGVVDAWNLSVTEQALLRDVAREEAGRGVAGAVRHVLAERTAAYRSGGLRAIAPYARPGSGVFAVGAEAEAMWARFAKLETLAPGVHAALHAYPRPSPLSSRHSFHASVIAHDRHPIVVLSHRAEFSADDYAIAVERVLRKSRLWDSADRFRRGGDHRRAVDRLFLHGGGRLRGGRAGFRLGRAADRSREILLAAARSWSSRGLTSGAHILARRRSRWYGEPADVRDADARLLGTRVEAIPE